jgi:glycosyltransferase involved in cell wall biosynthesis
MQNSAPPYEIIVVDSSPDQTPELVRRHFPDVQLIHCEQRTDPAQARNIGARVARGDVLAFIDSDCIAALDWLVRLYNTIQEGYDAVGGAIANGNDETLVSWAGYMCEFREFLPGGAPRNVNNLTLGNAAYRRELFWAYGGFPVGRFPQEDQVFHHALCRDKRRIRLDPRITVAHIHRTERDAFLQHQRRIGWANARVLRELRLPGAAFAQRRWLAALALPALVLFRFARTIAGCLGVERGLALRRPVLMWLIWQGMWHWGFGLLEGSE